MTHTNRNRAVLPVVLAAVLSILIAAPALAAKEETVRFDVDRLTVRNVIGEVRVEDHGGSGFEVVIRPGGRDAAESAIRLDRRDDLLAIGFPKDANEFVYPALGDGDTTLRSRDSNWLSDLIGPGRIKVRGSGPGLQLWVDLVVRVPRGATLDVEHGIGRIVAENVDGDLQLATRSGDVGVQGTRGELSVATGSGDIAIQRAEGDELSFATGSGNVEIRDGAAEEISVATGSGDVGLTTVDGARIELATGSGDITVEAARVDHLEIGTGSGEVAVELDRMGDGEYSVGTGSGDIRFTLPPGASAEVHAETDGGEIVVDLSDADFSYREEDEVRFAVGGGGATVRLGSGNGDIHLRE